MRHLRNRCLRESQVKNTTKTILFSAIPAVVVVLIIYTCFSVQYYYSQTHFFDPFLQTGPPSITRSVDDKHTIRILALGGSTTRNARLDEHDRYPSVLQKLLQQHYPTLKFKVFNSGMDWFTSKHSLINYTTNLRDWSPHIVIIMHGINDLYRSFADPQFARKPYHRLWSHFYGPAINGALPPTFEKHILTQYLSSLYRWFSKIRIKEWDIELSRYLSLNDFKRHLGYLIHYIKSDQSNIILMTQPYLYKDNMNTKELSSLWFGRKFCKEKINFFHSEYPSPKSLLRAMQAFNNTTRSLALDEKIMLIDLEPKINKDLSNFSDDVHYTAHGSHQVAKVVATAMIHSEILNRIQPFHGTVGGPHK